MRGRKPLVLACQSLLFWEWLIGTDMVFSMTGRELHLLQVHFRL